MQEALSALGLWLLAAVCATAVRKPRRLLDVLCAGWISTVVCISVVQAHVDKHARPDRDITVANLNILHGFACDPPVPEDGDQCRVRDRIRLLIKHIIAAGCPDIVTLQENVTEPFVGLAPPVVVGPLDNTVELIQERLPALAKACGFPYQVVFDPEGATEPPVALGRGVDEELILTRYPVLHAEVFPLYSPLAPFFFRHVLFARVDHLIEPVDVFTTHLAAQADFGSEPCGVNVLPPPLQSPACPADCVAWVDTVRECQAKQMARFIETHHDIPGAGLITGDCNDEPGTNVYNQFVERGWIDSHLAAHNTECNPVTGVNCTAGREDESLLDLEVPDLNQRQRIDFIFVIKPDKDARCKGHIDPRWDKDHDGFVTGLFAAEPNPFAPACGSAPLPICWASDHSGNLLDLNCKRRREPQDKVAKGYLRDGVEER
jgi:endonuclease/exonuclease/phosphatase family metal-dependent hydrolase